MKFAPRVTASGRNSKPVERFQIDENVDDKDADSDDDSGVYKAKSKKKKASRKDGSSKPTLEQQNYTHGHCATDDTFVIYFRPVAVEGDPDSPAGPRSILGTATFEISQYADSAFVDAAGEGCPAQDQTRHFCKLPAYTKDIAADRAAKIALRQRVEAGETKPMFAYRGSLIVRVKAPRPSDALGLAEIVSPFAIYPLRVKLDGDRLGYDKIAKCSVAPFFEFTTRVRSRYGIPLGVYEVNRYVHTRPKGAKAPAPTCLAGHPVPGNVALEFEFINRERVDYVCATPSIHDMRSLRPLLWFDLPASLRTNRAWSTQRMFELPSSVTIKTNELVTVIGRYSAVGDLRSNSVADKTPLTLEPHAPCSEWLRREVLTKRLASTLAMSKTQLYSSLEGWTTTPGLAAPLTFETVSRMVVWEDKSCRTVASPGRAHHIEHVSAPLVRALMVPFMSAPVFEIERFVGFDRTLLLSVRGELDTLAAEVALGNAFVLLVNRVLLESNPDICTAWPQLVELVAEELLVAEMFGDEAPPAEPTITWLKHHERVLQARAERAEELEKLKQTLREVSSLAAKLCRESLQSYRLGALLSDEIISSVERFTWPKNARSPLALLPTDRSCENWIVTWRDTAIASLAATHVLMAAGGTLVSRDLDDALYEAVAVELQQEVDLEQNITHVYVLAVSATDRHSAKCAMLRHPFDRNVPVRFLDPEEFFQINMNTDRGLEVRKAGITFKLCVPRADLLDPTTLANVLGVFFNGQCGDRVILARNEKRPLTLDVCSFLANAPTDAVRRGFNTGVGTLSPVLGGVRFSGDGSEPNLFETLTQSRAALVLEELAMPLNPEEFKEKCNLSFVEGKPQSIQCVRDIYNSNSNETLFVLPATGGVVEDVPEFHNEIANKFIHKVYMNEKIPWKLSSGAAPKTIVALIDHKSNALWDWVGGKKYWEDASDTTLRLFAARVWRSLAEKVYVFGNWDLTLARVVRPDFWLADTGRLLASFYCNWMLDEAITPAGTEAAMEVEEQ